MDSEPAGEYWLDDFVGEGEDWVSKYLQDIHFVNEESDDIGGRSMPMGNTANADVSSILTSISSSTITHSDKSINPITGQYYDNELPTLSNMTDEEKEREAEKLFVLLSLILLVLLVFF